MDLKILNKFVSLSRYSSLTLRNVYGIGKYKSKRLCMFIGVHPYLKTKGLNAAHFSCLNNFFANSYKNYEVLLKRRVQSDVSRLISMNCYRGKRLFLGLPCRGQRTHTNHRTSRKLKRVSS